MARINGEPQGEQGDSLTSLVIIGALAGATGAAGFLSLIRPNGEPGDALLYRIMGGVLVMAAIAGVGYAVAGIVNKFRG